MVLHYNRNEIVIRKVIFMTCTIQVRVDEELKTKSDALFKDLGTDTTSAIRMFLTQAIAENGFPFPIKRRGNYSEPRLKNDVTLASKGG